MSRAARARLSTSRQVLIVVWFSPNNAYSLGRACHCGVVFINPLSRQACFTFIIQPIATGASITLGQLRSIRVFVLGDVEEAGSYTVSNLSTMTNALLASAGPTEIGSLRNVQLRRNGETVSTLDLSDLLLEGDTSAARRLEPGDVIFVPPVGPTVSVEGEVRRPAIYEIGDEQALADVIDLAGGLTAQANEATIKLERSSPAKARPCAISRSLQPAMPVRAFATATCCACTRPPRGLGAARGQCLSARSLSVVSRA